MKKLFTLILILIIWGCSSQKDITKTEAISQQEFLNNPFGFDETIENFSHLSKPKFSALKLVQKNKHYPEKVDTIYKLSFKKSEIFFYKSYIGKEFLLAGKILNKQIKLKNDIHIGISKDYFINSFSDKINFIADSIQMTGEGTKYTFIFDEEKLVRINIDNYFD